jgi:hypothetical protein
MIRDAELGKVKLITNINLEARCADLFAHTDTRLAVACKQRGKRDAGRQEHKPRPESAIAFLRVERAPAARDLSNENCVKDNVSEAKRERHRSFSGGMCVPNIGNHGRSVNCMVESLHHFRYIHQPFCDQTFPEIRS